MMASQRFAPETLPPMKEDPGHYIVKKVKNALPKKVRERVPDKVEETAAAMLAFGYGMTFGSLYAVTRRQRGILLEGPVLGAVTWAAGSLGWLPATKLMPHVWRQKPKEVVPNLLSHILFGLVTATVFK
jgi:hypothetical protein